jgi:cytoskeletal protein CcmA (bactofilin family)
LASSTSNNITGLNLYQNRIIVRHEGATTTNISNLDQYDSVQDSDILFTATSSTGELTASSTSELFVLAGKTFNAWGTNGVGGAISLSDLDIRGTFTATSTQTISVSCKGGFANASCWDATGGTFNSASSTVQFTATSTGKTIVAGSSPFWNLTFNGSGGEWQVSTNTLDVNNNLNITAGTLNPGSQNINIAGNLTLSSGGLFTKGTGTTTFDGSSTNTWTDNNSTKQDMGKVIINGSSKTINLGSNIKATKLIIGEDDTGIDKTSKISSFWSTWTSSTVRALAFDSSSSKIYLGGSGGKFAVYDPALDTATDETDEISSFWGTNNISALTFDSSSSKIYLGGDSHKFAVYDPASDTATDKTSKISGFWSGYYVSSLTFDSTNTKIYLGGGDPEGYCTFAVYDPSTDTATDKTSKISSFWGTYDIAALAFDSSSSKIYLGGSGGKFAVYDPALDTATDETDEISSFWGTSYIYSLTFDSSSTKIYLGGYGKFAVYDPALDTATDKTSKISSFWDSYNPVYALTFDSSSSKIYLGGYYGEFAVYEPASDTATDKTSKISSFWGTNSVNALTFDSSSSKIYLGGYYGEFAVYEPSSDTATDKTSKLSSFWGITTYYNINSLIYDSSSSKIYLGGDHGKFAVYEPALDTATDKTSKISSFWGTNSVNALTFDSSSSKIYLGGDSGKFAVYDPALDTATDETDEISSFWGTSYIYSLTFDSSSTKIYLGGYGKFAVYDPASDTATDKSSKISSFWPSYYGVYALTFDSSSSKIYLGGDSFAVYDPASDTATSKASKISSFWGNNYVYALTFDSSNAKIYLGGGWNERKFAVYDPASDTATDKTSKISSFWENYGSVYALTFDSSSSKIYLGGGGGFPSYEPKFAVYDPASDAATDKTLKISSFWDTDYVNVLTFDSVNAKIYLGGSNGKFAVYPSLTSIDGFGPGSYTFTITGSGTGTSRPFIVSGTFNASTSLAEFISTSTTDIEPTSYYNLKLNYPGTTFQLYYNTVTTNDINIATGTLDVTTNNYNLFVKGNWTNSGTFTCQQGTVTFNATTTGKTITTGGSPFYYLTFNGSGGEWSLQDTATISDNLLVSDGTFNLNNKSMNVNGGYIEVDNGTLLGNNPPSSCNSTALVTLSGNGYFSAFGTTTLCNLTLSGSGTTTLQNILEIHRGDGTSGNLIISSGHGFSLYYGFGLLVGGNWLNSGIFRGIFPPYGGVPVTFNATTTGKTITTGGTSSPFYDITFNGSGGGWSFASGNHDVDNNFNIIAGSVTSTTGTLYVAGNWSNSGTFHHASGTVVFDSTATSTFSGATTFYNLTSNTSNKVLQFTAGTSSTTTIAGTLTLNGQACETMIKLRSTASSSQWYIDSQATTSILYVDVKDSYAITALTASSSQDSGNNANWTINLGVCVPSLDELHYRWRYDNGGEGENWSTSSIITTGNYVLSGVDILQDSSGNLFWSFGSYDKKAYLYKSTNNGQNWSTSSIITTGSDVLSGVDIFQDSSGNLFWSFGSSDNKAYLYKSTDNGQNWSTSSIITTGGAVRRGVDILQDSSGNLFWSFGSNDAKAYLYKSTDNGQNWSTSSIITTGGAILSGVDIFQDSSNNLFWSFGSGYGNKAYLYKSTDNGQNWSTSSIITTGGAVWSGVDILQDSSNNLFWSFGSEDFKAYLYKSTDNGQNWSTSSIITTGYYVRSGVDILQDSSNNLFWSFGSWDYKAYLYKSTDNGQNWSTSSIITTGGGVESGVDILQDSSNNLFWSFGSWNHKAYLYKSTNNGQNWSTSSIKTTGGEVESGVDILQDSSNNLFWSFGSLDYNAYLYKSSPIATWMASQDTATSTYKNTNTRLRFSIENSGHGIAPNYYYRIEYSEKTATSCENQTSGWSGVPTTTDSNIVMMTTSTYFSNGDITTNQLSATSGTFVSGKMVASTTNQTTAFTLNQNEYTEHEYLFKFTSNATYTTYCFRLTNSGSTSTFTYTKVAPISVTAPPSLDELHYRWRNDDGGESTSTWLAVEDATATTYKDTNTRLRFSIKNSGGTSTDYYYRIEYSEKTAGTCENQTSGWSGVPTTTDSNIVVMTTSTYFNNGDITTNQLSTTSGTFVSGKMVASTTNQTTAFTLNQNEYTEHEYLFKFTNNSTYTTYCFRLTNSGSTSTFTYTKVAQISVAPISILEFSVDSFSVNLGELSGANNYTATGSTRTYATTSATNGYVITAWADWNGRLKHQTQDIYIEKWTGTNSTPTTWGSEYNYFGYTTDDTTLSGDGGPNRFSTSTKYAGFDISQPNAKPVADKDSPASGDQHLIIYRVVASIEQVAGLYQTSIYYICTAQP